MADDDLIVEHFICHADLLRLLNIFGPRRWLVVLAKTGKDLPYDPMEGPDAIQE